MPRAHRHAIVAYAFLLAALSVAGCSGDGDVLARVGNVGITRDDFLTAARGNASSYQGSPDSAKLLLLDDLVRRELLVQGATLSGLEADTLFKSYGVRLENQLMRDRLFQQLGGGPIGVSTAEVDEFYRRRQNEAKVRVLFSPAQATMRAAQDELGRGSDFEAVAARFNLPGVLPPGGDLGYVQAGSLIPPLDDVLLEAPVGRIMGPYHVPTQGWFMLRVEDRRKAEQPPLPLMRKELEGMLRQRKQRAMLMRAIDRLGRAYEVKVEPGAANRLVQRLSSPPLLGSLGGQMAPPALGAGDKAEVLARWRGGVYTLGEANEDLAASANRPNFSMLPTVERWIENQALEHAARIEARKRLLDQDPEVRRAVRERLKSMLLDAYYGQAVGSRVQMVSDADVRALHAERASAFIRLDEVRVLTVTLPDSVAAWQLVEHGGHAGTLREAAAMAAPRARVQAQTIRYPNEDPFWGPLQATFMAMGPREYRLYPHPQGGWLVLQLQSKVQGSQAFEELPEGIVQFLRNEALERKRERRLNELSDSLQRAIPIRKYPERLARVPWPPPGAPPGAAPSPA